MPRQLKNQAGGWLNFPWEEFIGKDSAHGASWSSGFGPNQRATFEILVNWRDGPDVELALLGNANYNSAMASGLSRTIPARHPFKPTMFCTQIISATAVHWSNKTANFEPLGNNDVPNNGVLSEFAYWHLVLGFECPPWLRTLTDAQIQAAPWNGSEFNRFCSVVRTPSQQTIQRDKGSWKWVDPSMPAMYLNNQVTAPIGEHIQAEEMHIKWWRVPRAGLYGNLGLSIKYNANLEACYGKVNSAPLFGYPGNASTGVLRLAGISDEPVPSPFPASVSGQFSQDTPMFYNVTLHFSVWDPPAGNAANRGHNLAPQPGGGPWWLVNSSNPTMPAGLRPLIYQTTDLSQAFVLSAT